MKILWVKVGKLLPADAGGRIRSYQILRKLAAHNEVTLFSLYQGRRDKSYEAEVSQQFPGAATHLCRHMAGLDSPFLPRGIDYLRRFPSRAPYVVAQFAEPEVQRTLASWLSHPRFDVAVCDFVDASVNFPEVLATPCVLFQHNVESELWRRQAEIQSNWFKKYIFQLEAEKMFRFEATAVKRFHHIITVSEHDREQMARWVDPSRITAVPTGVDLQEFSAAGTSPATQPLVMFVGSMDWEANIDAVEYFCREIWPQVHAQVPEARFRIVGRRPHRRVWKLASDSIEITGTVASIAEHLAQAMVVVVPLRIGGGTRLKIYESMAMGKAIVSTSIGAEGLDVHAGRDILLADGAASFAEDVMHLLRNPELRERYQQAGAKLAQQYGWSVIAERFREILERVIATRVPERPVAAREPAEEGQAAIPPHRWSPRPQPNERLMQSTGQGFDETNQPVAYLMYHELQLPNREPCQTEQRYIRYVLPENDFRAQLDTLKRTNFLGMSVSEALDSKHNGPGVVITFDDGCETDFIAAAPLLKQAEFHATFYVVVGYLGRRGYLSPAQLRQLADMGFEVGCHSMTHPYLPELGRRQLHVEIGEAKERLQEIIGRRVDHFSCPGGRWSPDAAQIAREAGYRSVATSRLGANAPTADRFRLARVAVKRGLPLADFDRLCRGEGLFLLRTQQVALSLAKAVLGVRWYEMVRSTLVDGE